MEFQFDLVWHEKLDPSAAAESADSLVAEPVVLINSGGPENPIVMQRLFNPWQPRTPSGVQRPAAPVFER